MNERKDGPAPSFEARLAAARARQGLDLKPSDMSKGDNAMPSTLGVGLRVGVEMLSALIVGAALGYWLDRWLHTSPVLLSLFVLLGGAGGIANVWRLMAPRRSGETARLTPGETPEADVKDRHRGG
jgi:ATP synthase protein I